MANNGHPNCKSEVQISETDFGQLHVTCTGCPLDYYVRKM